jgi:hypothetical protein
VTENNQDSTRPAPQEPRQEDRPEPKRGRNKWPGRIALLALVALVAFGLYRGGKWIAESRVARAEVARTSSDAKSKDDQISQLQTERDGFQKASQDAMESLKQLQAQVDQLRAQQASPAGRSRQVASEATADKPRLNTHSAILTKTGG